MCCLLRFIFAITQWVVGLYVLGWIGYFRCSLTCLWVCVVFGCGCCGGCLQIAVYTCGSFFGCLVGV